ncbi:C39 family peptidase, partial [Patescibacteria group bacterium]|nr:C39 family peptidase [Patescibacteria group bacterium]
MSKTKVSTLVLVGLVLIMILSQSVLGAEVILTDVPYRNQVISYPDWFYNHSSCGFTCMIMDLYYLGLEGDDNLTEYQRIEHLYDNCTTLYQGTWPIYDYAQSDEYCDAFLSEYDINVKYLGSNDESGIKSAIDDGWGVICGTDIYGDAGHVIFIVGYKDNSWIVHDPAGDWHEQYVPAGGMPWSWAPYVEYPMGSFTIWYGVVMKRDGFRDWSAKVIDRSPTAVLDDQNDFAMLWVRLENNGREKWKQDEVHLCTFGPRDRSCGLKVTNHPEEYRWLGTNNRIVMEREEVPPGGVATFGIPVCRNGLEGNFPESFKLVADKKEGKCFGPTITWNVECRENTKAENTLIISGNEKLYYKQGTIHNHTRWSDGLCTVKELAYKAIKVGFDYVVYSDHSDYFNSRDDLAKYVDEINLANQSRPDICLVAGIEYTMLNYAGSVYDPKQSFIHIIGAGYNNLTKEELPDFFPWSRKGKSTTLEELINWHYVRGLPIIVCHPMIRSKNGISSCDLIHQYLFPCLDKISLVEFFDIGYDSSIATENNLVKMQDPGVEFDQTAHMYRDYLMPLGTGVSACSDYHGLISLDGLSIGESYIGGKMYLAWNNDDQMGIFNENKKLVFVANKEFSHCLQNMDRAKTSIVSDFDHIDVNDVVEALFNKRTVASRYHETFAWLKIDDQEWGPGKWGNYLECDKKVKLALAVQFHENNASVRDQTKAIVIARNCQVICKELVKLSNGDLLEFEFEDANLKEGVYNYVIMISGMEKNDWEREKIITSPIYVKVVNKDKIIEKPKDVFSGIKELVIFEETRHLGDSVYPGVLNQGFNKATDEGTVLCKYFDLGYGDLMDLVSAKLSLRLIGGEFSDDYMTGNPVKVNNTKIGDCLVKNQDPQYNDAIHEFYFDPGYLQAGDNELQFMCSTNDWGSRIDFDDFEIREVKIVLQYSPGAGYQGDIQNSNYEYLQNDLQDNH